MQVLKQSLENQTKELHASRAQISMLQMHIEGTGSGKNLVLNNVDNFLSESLDKYKKEIKKLQMELERLNEKNIDASEHGKFGSYENEIMQTEDKVIEIHEDQGAISCPVDAALGIASNEDAQFPSVQTLNEYTDKHTDSRQALFNHANENSVLENIENASDQNGGKQEGNSRLHAESESVISEEISEKMVSPFYLNKSYNSVIFWFLVVQLLLC